MAGVINLAEKQIRKITMRLIQVSIFISFYVTVDTEVASETNIF
jgi:hypothetical protein